MSATTKLKAFLLLEVIIIFCSKMYEHFFQSEQLFIFNWNFWIPLTFGIFIIIYAFNIRCQNPRCRARLVFRGISIFDVRWPSQCHKCGTKQI